MHCRYYQHGRSHFGFEFNNIHIFSFIFLLPFSSLRESKAHTSHRLQNWTVVPPRNDARHQPAGRSRRYRTPPARRCRPPPARRLILPSYLSPLLFVTLLDIFFFLLPIPIKAWSFFCFFLSMITCNWSMQLVCTIGLRRIAVIFL